MLTTVDPRDCGANRLATGHVFRLDWYGGQRCWCHNRPVEDLAAETRQAEANRTLDARLARTLGHTRWGQL